MLFLYYWKVQPFSSILISSHSLFKNLHCFFYSLPLQCLQIVPLSVAFQLPFPGLRFYHPDTRLQTSSGISAEESTFEHSHMCWLVPTVHPSHYLLFFDPTCWQWLTRAHSMLYLSCVLSTLKYLLLLALPFVFILPLAKVSYFLSSVVTSYWNGGLPCCIEMESLFGLKKPQIVNAKWMSWNRKLKKKKSSCSKANTQWFLFLFFFPFYHTGRIGHILTRASDSLL